MIQMPVSQTSYGARRWEQSKGQKEKTEKTEVRKQRGGEREMRERRDRLRHKP